jgi:hypothetical protein
MGKVCASGCSLGPLLDGPDLARIGFAVSSDPQTHGPFVGGKHMGDTTNELKMELKKSLSDLQTLRDEVRVRLHLASMDLKDQWNKLEPYLADVEQKASDVSEASRTLIGEAVKRLEKFRASLH